MINDVVLAAAVEKMGNNTQMIFSKGQLRNIQKKVKESGEIYYLADIRIPRTNTGDIYSQSFNVLNVCFSSDYVTENNITDNVMLKYKNNEVILQLSLLSSVRVNKDKDGHEFKNNWVQFYVEDIMILREVDKPTYTKQVVNL